MSVAENVLLRDASRPQLTAALASMDDALRNYVEALARNGLTFAATRPTPTDGLLIYRLQCPDCAVVVEHAGPTGAPPLALLRHDMFNHLKRHQRG